MKKKTLDLVKLKNTVKSLYVGLHNIVEFITTPSEIHQRGEDQRPHTRLAVLIAQELGLPEWEVDRIKLAMYYLGLGQLFVPDKDIKKSKGAMETKMLFLARERAIISIIPYIDDYIMSAANYFQENAKDANGVCKNPPEETPLASKILRLANSYVINEMQGAQGENQGLRTILSKEKNNLYDDRCIEALLSLFHKYPDLIQQIGLKYVG